MHNYLKQLQAIRSQRKMPVKPGKVYSVSIAHDESCQIYQGGECKCDPGIKFVEVAPGYRGDAPVTEKSVSEALAAT